MEDIGHVSYWAQMYALKAKCDACLITALGMQAQNMIREGAGEAMAYCDNDFFQEASTLNEIAVELSKI